MTLNLAISLLRQGRNGDQILQILESIASPEGDALARSYDGDYQFATKPTLQEIQF